MAIDPVRGADMDQTTPYVIIEGVYLVPLASPIKANAEVDRTGVRVVVAKGSAYDLYLTRELKHAQLVRVPTSPSSSTRWLRATTKSLRASGSSSKRDAKRVPNVRLLDGRFMVINQAMAVPKGRPAGARYLGEFVESVKASGFVAEALKRHGIEGAAVAPRGGSKHSPVRSVVSPKVLELAGEARSSTDLPRRRGLQGRGRRPRLIPCRVICMMGRAFKLGARPMFPWPRHRHFPTMNRLRSC